MANQRRPVPTGFAGFERPTSNFFRMPNEWTDITAEIRNLAELKVVEYILRHTWGYQEYDVKKHITIDEFVNGRRRQDGTRMDRGTGLSERAVYDGLRLAVERGLIEQAVDDSDRGRTKKFYCLRMQPVTDAGSSLQNPQSGVQSLQGGVQSLQGRGAKSAPRSEKDTGERQDDSKIRRASSEIALEDEGTGQGSAVDGRDQRPASCGANTSRAAEGAAETKRGSADRQDGVAATSKGAASETSSAGVGAGGRRSIRPRRVAQHDPIYQVLQAYVGDFAREFNDQAPLRASTMRAYNLIRRTGLPEDQFIGYLYAARAVTKERTGSIRSQAGEDAFGVPVKAKMAFFFAVLEDLLGLRDPAAPKAMGDGVTHTAD